MGIKAPQYPPSVETCPDGSPNPLFDPRKAKPAPPPPPPPRRCVLIRSVWWQPTPRLARILAADLRRLLGLFY
jgi:hypothetical protein